MAKLERRNILLVYVLGFVTLGIYFLYWYVVTKNEMNNKLGADIPTAWLIIVPVANLYFTYKYYEAFSEKVKKDNNAVLWFVLAYLVGIIMPAIVQSEFNKLAK